MGASIGGHRGLPMPTTLKPAVKKYLRAGNSARGIRNEYYTTLKKWTDWGGGVPMEILGHSVGGIAYRHYANRAPLAFKAIMTLPQPTAFSALVNGYDGECPCCRRRFEDDL